jgi:hypothetical protein
MKRLAFISCIAVFALAQTTIPHGQVQITALRQEKGNGFIRHLSGKCNDRNRRITAPSGPGGLQ